jgi:N-terminal domain of reverse transcriptase
MTATPEPKGKLDAATVVAANGPKDANLDWRAVDWRSCEEHVRRLRQRIFTASQAGDLKKVRNLQKLMLRSRANTLVSVRRVTERNAGRKTAGVDGEVVLSPQARVDLACWVQRRAGPWTARPVKRVYIPKKGATGKRRLPGIPVIADRALQACVASAWASNPPWSIIWCLARSRIDQPVRSTCCGLALSSMTVSASGEISCKCRRTQSNHGMTNRAGWRDIGAPASCRLRVSLPRREPRNSGRQSARDVSGLPPASSRTSLPRKSPAPAARASPRPEPVPLHRDGLVDLDGPAAG